MNLQFTNELYWDENDVAALLLGVFLFCQGTGIVKWTSPFVMVGIADGRYVE